MSNSTSNDVPSSNHTSSNHSETLITPSPSSIAVPSSGAVPSHNVPSPSSIAITVPSSSTFVSGPSSNHSETNTSQDILLFLLTSILVFLCVRFFCRTRTRKDIEYGHIDPFEIETELVGVIEEHVQDTSKFEDTVNSKEEDTV